MSSRWLPVVLALVVVTPSLAQAQSRRTRPDPTPVYEPYRYEPYRYEPYRYTPPPPPIYPVYVPVPARPTSGSTYDWRSGNRYSWDRDSSGETTVRGSNSTTGSLWRTTIQPDGSMRGTDSQGNMWRYSAGSNVYMNLGTGVICVGTGASRVCS